MSEMNTEVKPPRRLGKIIGWGLTGLFVAGTFTASIYPSPYLIERPGPVYNVLGKNNGLPILDISGKETYPTQGSLDLLTITFNGVPTKGASWLEVALSHLDPSLSLIPYVEVYPPSKDDGQVNQEAEVMMLDSQASAKAAALRELGIPYTSSVKVTAVVKNGASVGLLKPDDTLLTVDGEKATGLDQVRAKVQATKGERPVVFEISRAGVNKTVSITPRKVDGDWRVGIYVAPVPKFPFKIDINLENVTGPSGGQMFALGIYDKLTPGSLIGDNNIAGTGTIEENGAVGPIGGIKQKMYGAKRAGADFFLAPSENCSEVVGNIPAGLEVFRVSTLKESIATVTAIKNGQLSSLARCTK